MSLSNDQNLPMVTLVTVTYNAEHDLPEFLSCADRLDYPNLNLIIVDNNSSDNSIGLINKFKFKNINLSLLCNKKNLGIAAANNQGIKKALVDGSDWVILINNDVYFEANLVSKIILQNETELISTPIIPYYDKRDTIWFKTGSFDSLKGFTGRHLDKGLPVKSKQVNESIYTDYAPTCCMAIYKSVFNQVGMMDEDYFVYFDDTDFCYRLKKANIKIKVIQDAFLYHKVGASTGGIDSLFTIEQSSKNRVIFLRKNFGIATAIFFIFIFLSYYSYSYIIKKPDLRRLFLSYKSTLNGLMSKLT